MNSYDTIRQQYRPPHIKVLMIAESPPPSADAPGSRHFYRTEKSRVGDRLFTNTIKALYPETADTPERELQAEKEQWLRRFQSQGWYMIEAVEKSMRQTVTKQERRERIKQSLPRLIKRIGKLAEPGTKLILIKSNVYDMAAEPLRQAGFDVLNQELLDYPGRFNQRAYRTKLSALAKQAVN